MAASLAILARSAPEEPAVFLARDSRSIDSTAGLFLKCTFKISRRSLRSGKATSTWRSKRPGRSRALSSISIRLVAAITITPDSLSKPSISTRIWFKVCSSSRPAPPRESRLWATASISSMKIILGAFFFALLKRSRTREAPTPTNISANSEPEMLKNGTLASPATARAMRVLPVPGSPASKTPRGILAPSFSYFLGFLRKSTISERSCLAASLPATSSNKTRFLSGP